MAALFQIGYGWLRYSKRYRKIVLRHLDRLTQLCKAEFKNFLIRLGARRRHYSRVYFFH